MLVAEATRWVDECGVRAACTLQPASSAVCREFMLMVSRVVCYTPSLVGSPVFFVVSADGTSVHGLFRARCTMMLMMDPTRHLPGH